jgi:hypothetical protein
VRWQRVRSPRSSATTARVCQGSEPRKKQFAALRDPDRFFYLNDPVLNTIQQTYGITHRHTLAELVNLDTGVTVPSNAFTAG